MYLTPFSDPIFVPFSVVPLHWLVEQRLGTVQRDLVDCVALACDDGSDFDYRDMDHPTAGPQRSLFNCVLDFQREFGMDAQPHLHLTSFVIASPDARRTLSRTCLAGLGWNDDWWRPAQVSRFMSIENHSWDHNHPTLDSEAPDGMARGSFHDVDTLARADYEIAQATRHIASAIAPESPRLFCYPFGHASEYLLRDYLPRHRDRHGLDAAFTECAEPVTSASDRWLLPRYTCGFHWRSDADLRALLRDAR